MMRWPVAARTALWIILLGARLPPVAAQERAAPSRGWAFSQETAIGQATPAERAAVLAVMAEVERILRQVPELTEPRGFEVLKQIAGGPAPLPGQGKILESVFWLSFFPPTVAIAGEGSRCIEVWVNTPKIGPRDISPLIDRAGQMIMLEEPVGERLTGATIVHGGLRWDTPTADRRSGYVTFSSRGILPWKPVTREEYLQAHIYNAEGPSGNNETSARKALEKTTYQRWLEEAPERKKNREEAIAIAAQTQGRAAAEELRKALEQTEREVTATLKAQDAEERKSNQELLSKPSYASELRAQIAAMSPAERALPAIIGTGGLLEFTTQGDSSGRRVMTPNPDFWRVRKSRAEVHSITVAFHASGTCLVPAVRTALEKAYQTLNWAALKQIVDRPW